MSEVYVVRNPENGEVFVFNANDVPKESIEKCFPDYIVIWCQVEKTSATMRNTNDSHTSRF